MLLNWLIVVPILFLLISIPRILLYLTELQFLCNNIPGACDVAQGFLFPIPILPGLILYCISLYVMLASRTEYNVFRINTNGFMLYCLLPQFLAALNFITWLSAAGEVVYADRLKIYIIYMLFVFLIAWLAAAASYFVKGAFFRTNVIIEDVNREYLNGKAYLTYYLALSRACSEDVVVEIRTEDRKATAPRGLYSYQADPYVQGWN